MSGYSAPAFGVTPTGFVPKLVGDVELDLSTKVRGNLDPDMDVSPTEPMGQVFSIWASELAEAWEALATVYSETNPNDADDFLLDSVCAITGTKRRGATYSTVLCNATLGSNATIASGLTANVAGQPSNTWTLLGAADGNGNLAGPLVSTTAGVYSSLWRATQTGPIAANAGTLTVVAAPPSGFTSMTNPADATLGRVQESDTALRVRREAELAASGGNSLDAIRAAVLESSPGVLQAYVYENESDVTDAFGRPPHSVEVVIFDGTSPDHTLDNKIAAAMWANKIGGTPFYTASGDSGTVVDSQGVTRTVYFSRAQIVEIYIACTATPAGFEAQVKEAIRAEAASTLNVGSTVFRLRLQAAPVGDNPNAVAGVTDIPTFALDVHATPVATANIVLSTRQFPHVQTANILVNGI